MRIFYSKKRPSVVLDRRIIREGYAPKFYLFTGSIPVKRPSIEIAAASNKSNNLLKNKNETKALNNSEICNKVELKTKIKNRKSYMF